MSRIIAVSILLCALAAVIATAYGMENQALVLTGGTVIDVAQGGDSSDDIPDAVVVVKKGKIAAIGRRNEIVLPSGSKVYEVNGKYIVPGLVDSFATVKNESFARAFLYMGVTSVVSLVMPGTKRTSTLDPAVLSPRIYRAFIVPGEDAAGTILNGRELAAQVDALRLQGARMVLLYYNHTPEQTATIVKRARETGLGIMGELGHTPYSVALQAGVDAFPHTLRYSAELLPPYLKNKVDHNPFGHVLKARNEFIVRMDLHDNAAFDKLSAMYARGKTAFIPTMCLYYLDLRNHENPWKEPASSLIDPEDIQYPADPKTGWSRSGEPGSSGIQTRFAERVLELDAGYRRAGVKTFLAGSAAPINGTMPGITLHHELGLLVRIGLTPRQAIASATSNFGRVFRLKHTGEVRAGYDADLLVVNKNPLQDIRNLKYIHMMILDGKVIDRRRLLEKQRGSLLLISRLSA